MKVNIEVDLKPFQVPNFVIAEDSPSKKQEGFKKAPQYHLSDLDSNTLEILCAQFRREVFKKAGKPMPPEAG